MLSAVAALYDVHGNLPALDAVLSELDSELILVGGDVAVGPWPAETLERLRGGWPEEWPSATPEDATEYFERISREHA